AIRKLRDRCKHDRRVDTDRYRHRHVFFSRIVLADVTGRVLRAADIEAKPLRPFHLPAGGADVAPATLEIFGYGRPAGGERSGILTWRPNHLGQDSHIDFGAARSDFFA